MGGACDDFEDSGTYNFASLPFAHPRRHETEHCTVFIIVIKRFSLALPTYSVRQRASFRPRSDAAGRGACCVSIIATLRAAVC